MHKLNVPAAVREHYLEHRDIERTARELGVTEDYIRHLIPELPDDRPGGTFPTRKELVARWNGSPSLDAVITATNSDREHAIFELSKSVIGCSMRRAARRGRDEDHIARWFGCSAEDVRTISRGARCR